MDSIRRKVRGLRAMAAKGSGATDPERATAARLADRLEKQNCVLEVPKTQKRSITITFTFGGE